MRVKEVLPTNITRVLSAIQPILLWRAKATTVDYLLEQMIYVFIAELVHK
jgi:hypothetical protein